MVRYWFACGVCGTQYGLREAAEWCEQHSLPPIDVKPGDKIEAYERYDEPEADEVVSVFVGPSGSASAASGWSDSPEHWAEFLVKGFVLNPHTWVVKMARVHQYAKGGDAYSDEYDWGSVRKPGAAEWLDGSKVE